MQTKVRRLAVRRPWTILAVPLALGACGATLEPEAGEQTERQISGRQAPEGCDKEKEDSNGWSATVHARYFCSKRANPNNPFDKPAPPITRGFVGTTSGQADRAAACSAAQSSAEGQLDEAMELLRMKGYHCSGGVQPCEAYEDCVPKPPKKPAAELRWAYNEWDRFFPEIKAAKDSWWTPGAPAWHVESHASGCLLQRFSGGTDAGALFGAGFKVQGQIMRQWWSRGGSLGCPKDREFNDGKGKYWQPFDGGTITWKVGDTQAALLPWY
ncbi:MAG: hypothetical protein IT371_21355 [Deltaproteobacteria bacterium]|nr:hypothetical protein [Deltaproteobacteria bacterium]